MWWTVRYGSQWQTALNNASADGNNALPRNVLRAMRIYGVQQRQSVQAVSEGVFQTALATRRIFPPMIFRMASSL